MFQVKVGLVCLSRPGHGWHSGQNEGLVLQCKETAVVRPPPIPNQATAALGLCTLCLCHSAAPNQGPSYLLMLDRQETYRSHKNENWLQLHECPFKRDFKALVSKQNGISMQFLQHFPCLSSGSDWINNQVDKIWCQLFSAYIFLLMKSHSGDGLILLPLKWNVLDRTIDIVKAD